MIEDDMTNVISIENKNGRLVLDKYISEPFFTLGYFLVTDIHKNDLWIFIEWLKSKQKTFGTNTANLGKKNKNIEIEPEFSPEDTYILTKKKFINLLIKWDEVIKKNPQKIIISEENSDADFTIEAKF